MRQHYKLEFEEISDRFVSKSLWFVDFVPDSVNVLLQVLSYFVSIYSVVIVTDNEAEFLL
jgi:hypothetical protein